MCESNKALGNPSILFKWITQDLYKVLLFDIISQKENHLLSGGWLGCMWVDPLDLCFHLKKIHVSKLTNFIFLMHINWYQSEYISQVRSTQLWESSNHPCQIEKMSTIIHLSLAMHDIGFSTVSFFCMERKMTSLERRTNHPQLNSWNK